MELGNIYAQTSFAEQLLDGTAIEKDEKRLPLKKPYNPFKIRLKDATKPKINLDLNIKLNY